MQKDVNQSKRNDVHIYVLQGLLHYPSIQPIKQASVSQFTHQGKHQQVHTMKLQNLQQPQFTTPWVPRQLDQKKELPPQRKPNT